MGRHSAWREEDHPRRDDGKFGHGASSKASAGRRPSGGASNTGSASDVLASADIPVRGGDEIALDRHADGSLTMSTDHTSVTLSKSEVSDLAFYLDDVTAEETDPGSESWLKHTGVDADGRPGRPTNVALIRKDADGKYSLTLAANDSSAEGMRNAPALSLNDRDVEKILDAVERSDAARRVDTSYGPVDVSLGGKNTFGIRPPGVAGAELDKRSFSKFMDAWNVVDEGVDEGYEFHKGDEADNVTRIDVPTNAGKIRIERFGESGDDDYRLEIEPLDGSWGIVVNSQEERNLWEALINAGAMAGVL